MLLAALIVFVGYTVFGVTGFGASPITVPVLAHFLPLPFVLSLAAALDLGSAAVLGVHTEKQADVRELLVLAPFTIVGLALGVTLLVSLPRDATLFALGVFVCGYALYIMLHRGPRRPLGRAWAVPAGLLSGVLGALFGVGGPPYVVYIAGRIPDTTAQRATISLMVALNVGLRVAAFAIAGLFTGRDLWLAIRLLLPVAWAGVWTGNRVHMGMAPATLARIVGAVLFGSGASLIVRTL
ncbi:MAG: sulfite exporter TauE/SafE family protein [Candidatus Rokuibacteriota bacterium]|nr:MAG: sulfite exporter TauE/SafE family protein [Candidatus Rokubacteria bacterium]